MKRNLLLLKSSSLNKTSVMLAAFLLLVLLGISTATRAQLVYTIGETTTSSANSTDVVNRINYDGSNGVTISAGTTSGLVQPGNIALDGNNNRIFVSDLYTPSNTIKVINATTGALIRSISSSNSLAIRDIVYDVANDWLYYITEGGSITVKDAGDAVFRVHADGTGTQTIATSVIKNPYRLDVDAAANKVYVFDVSFSGRSLVTIDLANSNAVATRSFATSFGVVFDCAIDKVNGYIYYTTESGSAATLAASDALRRQNLDGTGDVALVASICNSPFRIALDLGNNRVYVADAYIGTQKILAVNLTSNSASTVLNLPTGAFGTNVPAVGDIAVPEQPKVTTTAASSITATGATLAGNLVYGYGMSTERGVVYSSSNTTPTVSDTKAANATVTTNGAYSASVSGLSASTTYYARAYAVNGAGTVYGSVVNFSTPSNDASLSAFTISSGTLSPTFATATTSYTASVTNATTSITVTPTRNQANATIKVNGTAVASGSASGNINLNIGDNTITTVLTAGDGITTKTYTLTVNRPKAAQTITFASTNTKTYGDADYAPGATASSSLTVSYASTNSAVATIVSGQIRIVGAGTTTITASQAGDASTLAAADVTQTLTVNKNAITVTATAGQTKVYGNADPTFAYTVTSGTVKSGDTFSGALSRAAGTDVGSYAINLGTLALNANNYTLGFVSNNFAITKRPLEITPATQTKVYGNSEPASYTYNFTNGTSLASGDGMTGAFTRTAGEIPGVYAFGIGDKHPFNTTTGVDQTGNYNITFVGANLTITKRPLYIEPQPATKVYGISDFAIGMPYYTTGTTLAPGDGMTGSFGRTNTSENVGVYTLTLGNKHPVSVSDGSDKSAYYTITFVSSTLTITAKPLTITANARTKTYGDADPALTYSNSGLAFSDVFTGSLTRVAGETPGDYAISQGTLAVGSNYSITFTGNNLTIGKKTINVSAAAKNKTFGDTDPTLTYTNDALVTGDSFTGAITRATGEAAGSYAIGQGTLALSTAKYNLNFTGANFTINKKVINVAAVAKTKTYGDSDPALTYTADALVGSDSFTGALSRAAGETFGTYAISQNTLALNSNYTLNYTGANFSIGKRALSIDAYSPEVQFGNPDATIGYSYGGTLAAGDQLSGTLGREPGTAVGSYAVTLGTLAVTNSASYDLSFHTATYKIVPREIQVTGGTTFKVYGDADPAINYSIYSGSLLGGTQITGTLVRDAGENAGPHNVTQGTLAINDANYKLTYLGGSFEIDRAPLTLTIDNKTKVATKPNPALTYSVSGYKNGDTEATAFTSAIQLITDANINSGAGTYNIYNNGGLYNPNYNLSIVGGTLTVTPASSINTLASATLNGGGFNQSFSPDSNYYSVSVPNGSTSATFIATVTDPLSSITIGYDPATATPLASGAPYTVTFTGGNTEQLPVNVTAEDGTVNSYYFNITPIPSDSKLSNLNSSVGIIAPSFNPLVTSYSLDVSAETTSVLITPTTHDPNATARVSGGEGGATGAKNVNVIEGINPISINVRSADRTSSTLYQLLIKRPIRLASLELSAGTLFPAFDPNVTTYTAKVNTAIPAITVTPKGNQSYFNINVNGDYVAYGDASAPVTINEDGSTTITVKITAGDGETSKTYNINVVHGSSNASLANIGLNTGSLDPAFDSTRYSYTVYLPNNQSALTFTPATAEANATVKVNNADLAHGESIVATNIPVGLQNYYIAVTAADGVTTKTYTLSVYRAYSQEAGFSNILLSAGTLSPTFDQSMHNTYNVYVSGDVTTIDVTPVLLDTTASLQARLNGHNVPVAGSTFTGTLQDGINSMIITSTAQDGTTSAITTLIITRLGDPTLSNLAVSTPTTFSPPFNKNTYDYVASVDYKEANYALTPTLMDPNSVLKVNGNIVTNHTETTVPLVVGDNTITIAVTAPDSSSSRTYTIVVTRAAASTDNTLASLTPSTGAFLFGFSNTQGYLPVVVPSTLPSITVVPVANDNKATIIIDGQVVTSGGISQPLAASPAGQWYQVTVIAENGDTRLFSINVKNASTNANLYRLETTAGVITPTFDKNVLNYNLYVPSNRSSIGITAQVADSTARVSINGDAAHRNYYEHSVPLVYGPNNIAILVTSQDGPAKTYNINITRADGTNANLTSLSVDEGALSPAFSAAATNYTVAVASTTSSVHIRPLGTDANAKVSVGDSLLTASGVVNYPVTTGNNSILVKVTAQDGSTIRSYTLNIKRAASPIATLSKLYLVEPSVAKTNTTGGPGDYNSTATVKWSVNTIRVVAEATDAGATVKVNGVPLASGATSGPVTLNADSTFIWVQVTAANNFTVKNYVIKVVKEPAPLSAIATLNKLYLVEPIVEKTNVSSGPGDYNSTASVPSSISSIKVIAEATDAGATIRINGVVTASGAASAPVSLSEASTDITVEVTAANNTSVKTYVIKVTKELVSSIATLKKLYLVSPAVAKTNVSSGPAEYNSTANVSATTGTIKVVAVATDTTATIRINGVVTGSGKPSAPITLNAGENTINIVVTAQNGTSTHTWAIIVTKAAPTIIAAITNRPTNIGVVQPADQALEVQPEEVIVKQAVSPNGDGINDRFTIEGISAFPENKVQVMNRNGEVVYEAKGYDNQGTAFDGHGSKGIMQQPGTYFYSVEYKKGAETLRKTGYLVLKY